VLKEYSRVLKVLYEIMSVLGTLETETFFWQCTVVCNNSNFVWKEGRKEGSREEGKEGRKEGGWEGGREERKEGRLEILCFALEIPHPPPPESEHCFLVTSLSTHLVSDFPYNC
jgi:hypothetical protein